MHSVRLGDLPRRPVARQDLQHHLRLQRGRVPPSRHVHLRRACQVPPCAASLPEVNSTTVACSRFGGHIPQTTRGVDAHFGRPAMHTGSVRVRGRVCLRTPAAPFRSLPHQQSVPEGCRAPLRGGAPVGRPAPGRKRGRRRPWAAWCRWRSPRSGLTIRDSSRTGSPLAFPRGIDGPGATLGEGWQRTSQPSPCRMRHAEYGDRSRPRPQAPVRHRRSLGRGATASTPATCGNRQSLPASAGKPRAAAPESGRPRREGCASGRVSSGGCGAEVRGVPMASEKTECQPRYGDRP